MPDTRFFLTRDPLSAADAAQKIDGALSDGFAPDAQLTHVGAIDSAAGDTAALEGAIVYCESKKHIKPFLAHAQAHKEPLGGVLDHPDTS